MAPVSNLSARRLKQLKKPLKNLPERVKIASRGGVVVFGPHVEARKLSVEYMRCTSKGFNPPKWYTKVDRFRAEHISYAYALLTHSPYDEATRTAYAHLAEETLKQYQFIKKTNLKVEWIPDGQNPYEETPRLGILDVIENNHLWLFPTMNGFGNEGSDEFGDHPLLDETDEFIDGRRLVVNDVFRIVHDYFGHIKEGVGFRADGEENAWRNHAAMYSEKALGAITTELRGQNSWVNYGDWGDFNRTAKPAQVKYAKQKAALLPRWMWNEGRLDPH